MRNTKEHKRHFRVSEELYNEIVRIVKDSPFQFSELYKVALAIMLSQMDEDFDTRDYPEDFKNFEAVISRWAKLFEERPSRSSSESPSMEQYMLPEETVPEL
jgi:CRISPR/Cas system CSM-associated protein Csm2 small subunit